MSAQTASFKVTLVSKGEKLETRRFILPWKDLSSYSNLQEKLNIVFQSIDGVPCRITWKDSDGDEILISSDEELMIAVKEMEGDVYRLTIETLETESFEDVNGGSVHPMVVCDGCNGEIKGFRYTCAQCPDYDLCPKCEMSEHHPEHLMFRIPFPMQGRLELRQHLAQQMSRCGPKCGGLMGISEGSTTHSSAHKRSTSGQRCRIPQFVHQFLRNVRDSRPGGGNDKLEDEGKATYLRSIGETVATLLDPLGIDVDIKVDGEEDGKESEVEGSPPANGDGSSNVCAMKEEEPLAAEGERGEVSCTVSSQSSTPGLLPGPTRGPSQPTSAASDGKQHCLYPNLGLKTPDPTHPPAPMIPSQCPASSPVNPPLLAYCPSPPVVIPPTKPHVMSALNAMTAMGFRNEGGWLSSLLLSVNGDIHRALDILQPVKK